jgi:hypothetical protein
MLDAATALAVQPLAPNIMRRATKRLTGGRQSSAPNPNTIEAALIAISREHGEATDIRGGIDDFFREFPRVPQTKVESLSRDRVQGLGRVAYQYRAPGCNGGIVF